MKPYEAQYLYSSPVLASTCTPVLSWQLGVPQSFPVWRVPPSCPGPGGGVPSPVLPQGISLLSWLWVPPRKDMGPETLERTWDWGTLPPWYIHQRHSNNCDRVVWVVDSTDVGAGKFPLSLDELKITRTLNWDKLKMRNYCGKGQISYKETCLQSIFMFSFIQNHRRCFNIPWRKFYAAFIINAWSEYCIHEKVEAIKKLISQAQLNVYSIFPRLVDCFPHNRSGLVMIHYYSKIE